MDPSQAALASEINEAMMLLFVGGVIVAAVLLFFPFTPGKNRKIK